MFERIKAFFRRKRAERALALHGGGGGGGRGGGGGGRGGGGGGRGGRGGRGGGGGWGGGGGGWGGGKGKHHHHHHHGGGRRGWWGGGPGYYYAPEVYVVDVPQVIIVDAQTGTVVPTGVRVNRPNGAWVHVASAYIDQGQMVISGTTGTSKRREVAFQVKVPIIDRPPAFPNNRVAYLP